MTKIQVRKQFTTISDFLYNLAPLFSIWRRYKFESNSQPISALPDWYRVVFNMTKIQVRKQFTTIVAPIPFLQSCFQYDEDTSSKAIHNKTSLRYVFTQLFSIWRRYKFESNSQRVPISSACCLVVFNMTKIQVRKQFTTVRILLLLIRGCFQYDEDTSSKAIHNSLGVNNRANLLFSIWRRYKFESNSQLPMDTMEFKGVVFNMTKIQVRKQFTTARSRPLSRSSLFSIWRRYKFESNSQHEGRDGLQWNRCFQYDEDTSSKAIHNHFITNQKSGEVVFNMTKIQVRKQFTTAVGSLPQPPSCFQYDEDTSSKAIHNRLAVHLKPNWVVFNMTKIQVRKQFTTNCLVSDADHELFSIWRRYKFESNSQHRQTKFVLSFCCFQYDEDTSSKAIHNSTWNTAPGSLVVFNMTKIQVRKQFTTGQYQGY